MIASYIPDWPISWDQIRERINVEKAPPILTKATWYTYRYAIDLLEDVTPDPAAVDVGVIVGIRKRLEIAGQRPASVRSRLSQVRALCAWLVEEEYLDRTPFKRRSQLMPRVRKSDTQKFALTSSQAAAMLDQADREAEAAAMILRWQPGRFKAIEDNYRTSRLRALLYLVSYTGLRANEALHLRCADVASDGRVVNVTGADRETKTVE
jgi:integrase